MPQGLQPSGHGQVDSQPQFGSRGAAHRQDRRRRDVGPPGRHERRRGLEARKPEVVELEISESEWAALNEATMPMPLR